MESHRLMALDYGFKRIGVAISDPFALFAQPHRIIDRTTNQADFAILRHVIDEEQIAKIIIGLPSGAHGEISPQAAKVIRWARKLAAEISVPIVMWDETHSSEKAEAMLAPSKRRASKPTRVDALAAAIILQDYLEAGGVQHESGRPLDTFTEVE
jgi:putative holliday junction resolvase